MRRVLQECLDRIVANPEVQRHTGITPGQAAAIALSGITVFGVGLICYFCPAARDFLLNIVGSGYNLVVQAIAMLDVLTGGRLTYLRGQVSLCWSGFTNFMSQAWARLVCWANGNPGEAIIAEAREMVPLNQRARNNNRASEACREPHAANQEGGQDILRPAPPVPQDSQRRRQEVDRGALADDEASDGMIAPELDQGHPLEPIPEDQCEGISMLGALADRLAAVGRCPAPTAGESSGAAEEILPSDDVDVQVYKIFCLFLIGLIIIISFSISIFSDFSYYYTPNIVLIV